MLIARREDCSGRLGALLAERGGEETLIALAQNQRARLDGAAMDVMTARTRQYARLHEPMIARLDLPPLTLTRLYFFVAPALKKEILMRADIIEPALAAGAASATWRKFSYAWYRPTSLRPRSKARCWASSFLRSCSAFS